MNNITDIGYYIFHNCKRKDCKFFPVYNKYIGWYGQFYKGVFYPQMPCCEGCETYKKAKKV